MKNGTMFADLIRYSDSTYFNDHSVIRLTTLYREREYEVIAAFYSELHIFRNTFPWYEYITFEDEEHFLEFVEHDYEKSISNRARTSFKKNKVRDLAILSLFLSSGIRCAELVGINLNDLNLETGKVRVMRKEGKKDVVPIAHFSHKYITDYFESRSSLNTDVEALFITDYNQTIRKISNASINKLVAKYSGAYKVRVTPHTLRHTFATRLYNVSHSQVLVSNQLGHSSTKPTELYTHIVSAEAKDALRKL